MHYYFESLLKYADFTGTATRSEFWVFVAINGGITLLCGIADALFTLPALSLLFFIFLILNLPPTLAISIRRLHDTGRSGWYALYGLIPFGQFVMIYFFVQPSSSGRSLYQTVAIDTTLELPHTEPTVVSTQNTEGVVKAVDPGLLNFVRTAREQGKSDIQIKAQLLGNGWSETNIDNALVGTPVAH